MNYVIGVFHAEIETSKTINLPSRIEELRSIAEESKHLRDEVFLVGLSEYDYMQIYASSANLRLLTFTRK